ncbi:TPA: hypothetical protein SMQ86_006058 [Pseudomonas aeruginosa]|nr:hypothetical protein [Pseudomonas aeruginosa]
MSRAAPEILCGGKALKDFIAVRVDIRRGVQWIPEARVVLQPNKGERADWWKACSAMVAKCRPGVELCIRHEGLEVFRGVVVEQSVQWSEQEVRLLVKHPLQRLVNTQRSQVFQDKSDSQILAAIFKEHKVASGTLELKTRHQQMVQWDCTDWQFIRSRLAAHGAWLIPKRDKVECRVPALAGKPHVLKAQRQNADKDIQILDAQWTFNNEMQAKGVSLRYWDVERQALSKAVTGKAKSFGSGALDPGKLEALCPRLELIQSLWPASDEAQALADGRHLAQLAAGVQVWLRIREPEGVGTFTLKYELGDALELSGFGTGFSGKGVITTLEHQWWRGTWTSVVATGVPLQQAQDAASLPRNTRLVVGVVEPYRKDSRGLNRVLVKVPLLGAVQPLWARLASPYASKEGGLYLYPEAGDEVVLDFVDDDPRYPLILGSLHNPKNKALFEMSQANALKGFKYVLQGKEQSWLFDVKEKTFTLTNDKDRWTIGKDGQQVQSEGKFALSAKQDMTAEAGGSFDLSAKKRGGLSADQAIEIQSKQKLLVQGVSQVEVKGGKIDLKNG